MELTVARFRQIVTAIAYREYLSERSRRRLTSWSTKQIVEWIASTIPQDPKSSSPSAVDIARSSVFVDDEEREFFAWMEQYEKDHPAEPKTVENAPGSFERFMGFAAGRA